MKVMICLSLLLTFVFSCSHTGRSFKNLDHIIASKHRSEANKARDEFRHPKETIEFFDIKPHHHVVEISPGTGWYTEILAPYLKNEGKLSLAIFSEYSHRDYRAKMARELRERIHKQKSIFGNIAYTIFDLPYSIEPFGAENSVDRIVTFRNAHNWTSEKKQDEVFSAFYRALKKGGILGIVEHRTNPKFNKDKTGKSGYLEEKEVIRIAQKAGFKLLAKSEINANPKDKTQYPSGVWTLPPSLKLGEKNKAQYIEIGESDRMTLKFVK